MRVVRFGIFTRAEKIFFKLATNNNKIYSLTREISCILFFFCSLLFLLFLTLLQCSFNLIYFLQRGEILSGRVYLFFFCSALFAYFWFRLFFSPSKVSEKSSFQLMEYFLFCFGSSIKCVSFNRNGKKKWYKAMAMRKRIMRRKLKTHWDR